MQKIIEIIRLKNLPAAALFLSAITLPGCAAPRAAATRDDSAPGGTPAVALARTPENKAESSRIEPLETHDSEEPEMYRPAAETASTAAVTKANFDRIKIGMTYREAVGIFGGEGMRTSTMKVNNRETTIFKWTVADFSKYIDLHFENDKVVGKKQKGLL